MELGSYNGLIVGHNHCNCSLCADASNYMLTGSRAAKERLLAAGLMFDFFSGWWKEREIKVPNLTPFEREQKIEKRLSEAEKNLVGHRTARVAAVSLRSQLRSLIAKSELVKPAPVIDKCKWNNKPERRGDFIPSPVNAFCSIREVKGTGDLINRDVENRKVAMTQEFKRTLREWPTCKWGGEVSLTWNTHSNCKALCFWKCTCGK